MAITDAAFQRKVDQKRWKARALTGGDGTEPKSDPNQQAMERHSQAIQRAYQKTLTVMPERGPRQPVPSVRPDWDVHLHQVVGSVELSTALSLELKRLVKGAGIENILTGLSELGYITGYGPDSS